MIGAIVVMGVSGSGKTTIGTRLAAELGWPYADADEFHPPANVAKMAAGQPLTDADREPWLAAIAHWIDERRAAGQPGVVSCSALRRSYRDRLRHGRQDVLLIFLDGSRELIESRMTARRGHFMAVTMLDGQLAALERPEPDEAVLTVPIDADPDTIVAGILRATGLPRG